MNGVSSRFPPILFALALMHGGKTDTRFFLRPNPWCLIALSWYRLARAPLVAGLYSMGIP